MPSSYPGAADSFGAPAASDPQSTPVGGRTHSQSHTDLGDAVEAIEAELGINPSGAAATVAARLDAHDASMTPHIPAGAVSGSGAVGAVKWDESVGRRCFVWDTVNSRWQMIYGDTGWRNITTVLENGWTATNVSIRRVGFQVFAAINAASKTTATADIFYTLPSGFRAFLGVPAGFVVNGDDYCYVTAGNDMRAFRGAMGINGPYSGQFSWSTIESWPSALPGSASGVIPT